MVLTRSLRTEIRRLHHRRGREKSALSLAEGVRLVEEALAAGIAVRAVVVTPGLEATPRGRRLAESLANTGIRVEHTTEKELEDLAETEHPQGILAVVAPRVWSLHDLPVSRSVLLVLDGVQDPGNVGTMIRSAWGLGAGGVLALPGTVDLTNPKVLRASMGAVFRLPVMAVSLETLVTWLEEHHVTIWVTAADGEPISALHPPPELALVVGNEGAGVRAEVASLASHRVAVSIRTDADSLNVSVATGILLHEVLRDD